MAKLNKEQIKNVTEFLRILIRLSVKEAIEERYSFVVENEQCIYSEDEDGEEVSDYYAGKTDRFSDQIVSKYQIQITGCEQSEAYATDHEIKFEMTGELKAIFEKNGVMPSFVVLLNNQTGEPRQTYIDANYFAEKLYFPEYISLEAAKFEDFDAFYGTITKLYIFELMRGR